ncbi:MAG TPA: hypothetical protein VIO85_02545 [Candidatus Dormibacteraeota bacterium]
MDPISQREPRVLWSFWIACGLAVSGAILPLVLAAGGTNRIGGAAIPFGVAAMALAAAALLYQQGRPLATALYFIAGMALVYGMLTMIAVPLRLAVIGTCDPAPAICPSGFERPMSGGEDSGLAIGVAMGTLAILVGFFGLLMLFRLRPQTATPPPMRIEKPWVPPAAETPAPATAEPEPTAAAVSAPSSESPAPTPEVAAGDGVAAPSKPARKPRAKPAPKPPAELAAPEERLELPAPEEPLELPAPSEAEADSTS